MRILWLTIDRSHRVAQQFDIFRHHVSQIADVVTLMKNPAGDKGQNAWQLSRHLIDGTQKTESIVANYLNKDNEFDFIFCDAYFAYLEEEWHQYGIPSSILIEDVHQEVPKFQIKMAEIRGIRNIFHRFNFPFHKFHPEARRKFNCFWLPHSINTKVFKKSTGKNLEVIHVGVSPKTYYPFRAQAVKQLKAKEYFTRIDRPKEGGDRKNKWPLDNDYADLLSKAKICITGGSIFNAPVQKYVEIPAVNTLLMSNWFPDLGLLGFVPNKNMVVYNKRDLVSVVETLLNNNDRLSNISNKGYELITTKHTSVIRAKQFINNICQINDKPLEFSVPPCSYQVNFRSSKIKHDPKLFRLPELNKNYVRKSVTPEINKEEIKPISQTPKVVNNRVIGTDWRSRIK